MRINCHLKSWTCYLCQLLSPVCPNRSSITENTAVPWLHILRVLLKSVSGFCHHPSLWCTLLLVSAIHSVCSQVVMWKEKIYPDHVMLCTVFSYKALAKGPSQRPAAFGSGVVHLKNHLSQSQILMSQTENTKVCLSNWPEFTSNSTLFILLKFPSFSHLCTGMTLMISVKPIVISCTRSIFIAWWRIVGRFSAQWTEPSNTPSEERSSSGALQSNIMKLNQSF